MTKTILRFVKLESSGGIILLCSAILALIFANSPISDYYFNTLSYKILGLSIGHWVNDGLMAIFFLLIGLEVKRELIEGALNSKDKAIFPLIAAVGGMLIPALFYLSLNYSSMELSQGWAIPAATDIAFALGILALLPNVPSNLRSFLLALAIIDDLGVILIIALFYSTKLNAIPMLIATMATLALALFNLKKVMHISWYLIVGFILWIAVLKSGIHATLAGVILGFLVPIEHKNPNCKSPLKLLEHKLHYWVTFLILPIFAFCNAGIQLLDISLHQIINPLSIGIVLGLFLGKPIGIYSFSYLSLKFKMAKLPAGVNLIQIFGVSILCGIGFTMSIFISSLAFLNEDYINLSKIGILGGSFLSAIIGFIALKYSLKKQRY